MKKFLFLGVLLIPALWLARPAGAGQALSLGYNVYLGGLHILAFDIDIALNRAEYSISAAGATKGVVGVFYKWSARFDSNGRLSRAGFRPARYDAVTKRRGKVKSRRLLFDGEGKYSVERDPPRKKTRKKNRKKKRKNLPPVLPRDTVDPLTAVLEVTHSVLEEGACARTIPVFDGKRRYNLVLKYEGPDTVEPSHLSIFKGSAVRCRFTIERISGFKKRRGHHSYWEESEESPVAVWVATLADGAPPVPVRFEGELKLGGLVIHLARAEVKSTVADSRPSPAPVP